MNQSIALKSAMTIMTPAWHWVHESAWDVEHSAFAENCPCFSGTGLQRVSWLSTGERRSPNPLRTGYIQVGRWILQRTGNKEILAAVSLQWEEGMYSNAWLHFYDHAQILFGDQNPAYWLVEAVTQRLGPDLLTLHGDSVIKSLSDIGEQTIIGVPNSTELSTTSVLKIDAVSWKNYAKASVARQELDWIRKQFARENRAQEFARAPRKRPFLFRILMALSPMRGRRSSKMIHPIDRLKQRLT